MSQFLWVEHEPLCVRTITCECEQRADSIDNYLSRCVNDEVTKVRLSPRHHLLHVQPAQLFVLSSPPLPTRFPSFLPESRQDCVDSRLGDFVINSQ